MFPQAVWDSLCWLELATAPRWAPARALLSGARARLVYSPPLNRCGISCSTAMKKLRIETWEIAHPAVSRRPPISLDTSVARIGGNTYERESVGSVRRSRPILCRPAPTPSVTIRNFSHRCVLLS
jgi:hypothetical protein